MSKSKLSALALYRQHLTRPFSQCESLQGIRVQVRNWINWYSDNSWIGDTKCRAKISTMCEVTWNTWESCERSWYQCLSHHALKILRFFVYLPCCQLESSSFDCSLFRCTHTVVQVWVFVHPMVTFMFHVCGERCFWSLRLLHSLHLLPYHLSDHPAVPTVRQLQLPYCCG